MFDREADGRAKTGLSRRTERLVTAYLADTERLPDAVLFCMRTGSPYREATLTHDFADVRELAFPSDTRKLMDMRRSVSSRR